MSIKYDSGLNAEMRRVVHNFNQKRKRAIKRGYHYLPPVQYVSELKARYDNRSDLLKELKYLERFNTKRDQALKVIESSGGAKAIQWEFDYLKAHQRQAKEFFRKEYNLISSKVGDFPGERMRLDAIAKKLDTLDLDLAYMTQSQFNSYRSAINEVINKPLKYAAGYRGFLAEVEGVMRMVGIEDSDIKQFFEKINALTPEEFHYLYEKNDLVSRVFELADSPEYDGTLKLNTTQEVATDLVNTLIEETDMVVKEAKEGVKNLDDFAYGVKKTKVPTKLTQNKIPKSSLTEDQLKDLKLLGWEDIIDETK